MEKNNIIEIVKKNIENFKILTKETNDREIKKINQKLDLYIKSIEENKFIQINKDKMSSIKDYNNLVNNTIIMDAIILEHYGATGLSLIFSKGGKNKMILFDPNDFEIIKENERIKK